MQIGSFTVQQTIRDTFLQNLITVPEFKHLLLTLLDQSYNVIEESVRN